MAAQNLVGNVMKFVVGPSRGRGPDHSATWASSTWISQCNFRNTCL